MASHRGQPGLFGLDPLPLEVEPRSRRPRDTGPGQERPSCSQLVLFTDRVVLAGALSRAVISAEYEEALRIEDQLSRGWGEKAVPAELRFVRQLGPDFWERAAEPAVALEGWGVIERSVAPGTTLWRRVRNGFFGRLLSVHSAEAFIGSHPAALRLVVDTLVDSEAVADARRLLRDALLAGWSVDGDGMEDRPVAELFTEELGPRWLASLGAIKRLWPLPRPTPEGTDAIAGGIHDPLPLEDEARALAFWDALRLAELRGAIREPLIHAARTRMKRLNEDLHALYMYGTGPFSKGDVDG